MNDSQVLVSLISMVGGVIVAYITNVAAKRVQARKEKDGPVDRMEQMFDGYERLIKQKDLEDQRKAKLIKELEEEIAMTRRMIKSLEESLAISQRELEISRQDNIELKEMLQSMREEYDRNRELDSESR